MDKLATAYHEAGHAVIDLHHDLSFKQVTIKLDGDVFGRVRSYSPMMYAHHGLRAYRRVVRLTIVGLYAGLEAEKQVNPQFDEELSRADEDKAFDLLREYPVRGCSYIGDDVYCNYLEKLRREARRLVKKLWKKIDTVAKELLERETLTEDEVRAILGELNNE